MADRYPLLRDCVYVSTGRYFVSIKARFRSSRFCSFPSILSQTGHRSRYRFDRTWPFLWNAIFKTAVHVYTRVNAPISRHVSRFYKTSRVFTSRGVVYLANSTWNSLDNSLISFQFYRRDPFKLFVSCCEISLRGNRIN